MVRRSLGNLGLKRSIAARTAEVGIIIKPLRFLRQRKKLRRQFPRARDQRGVQPVVFDHGKAISFKGTAKILRNLRVIGVERNECDFCHDG